MFSDANVVKKIAIVYYSDDSDFVKFVLQGHQRISFFFYLVKL